jgi:hypothetical protein
VVQVEIKVPTWHQVVVALAQFYNNLALQSQHKTIPLVSAGVATTVMDSAQKGLVLQP